MSDDLNAETRLAVQAEVGRVLTRIGALFGVANIAVLLGAVWFMWSSVTGQTAGLASSVKQEVLDDLSTSRGELNDAVNTANQLIGRLEQSRQNLGEVEDDIQQLQADLVQLGDVDTVNAAAGFLTAWKGAPDLAGLTTRLANMETDAQTTRANMPPALKGAACGKPQIHVGQTPVTGTQWQRYQTSKTGAFVEINTKDAGFSEPPLYLTSLGGAGGHWSTSGAASIYAANKDSFRVYIRWSDFSYSNAKDLVDYAKSSQWHVNWVAIGC